MSRGEVGRCICALNWVLNEDKQRILTIGDGVGWLGKRNGKNVLLVTKIFHPKRKVQCLSVNAV